jgi:isoleucyl-tRNA synthetase
MIAPFMPFLAEDIYQKLSVVDKKESVHLESWPEKGEEDEDLVDDMEEVRRTVSLALEQRALLQRAVRQPLGTLYRNYIPAWPSDTMSIFDDIIKEEVNVKQIVYDDSRVHEIELDPTLTPELEEEGEMRKVIRLTQEERKKKFFIPGNKMEISMTGPASTMKVVQKFEEEIKKAVNAVSITLEEGELKIEIRKID